MLKRIINVLLVSAVLAVGLTASVAMAQTTPNRDPDEVCTGERDEPMICDKGQPGADEPKDTGKPDDPNAWGSVAAQLADEGVMGAHSSDPVPVGGPGNTGCFGENKELNCRETPRDGLGNVAKNDFDDHGVPTGTAEECAARLAAGLTPCDSGDNISDHACIAAAAPLPGFPEVQPDCTLDPQEVHGP